MPITYYLVMNAPVILASCYGLGLAFKNWPIHQGAGKLMIVALLLKLGGIAWNSIQWLMLGTRTTGQISLSNFISFTAMTSYFVEAIVLAALSAAVFYGRPRAATWPLRSA